MSSTRVMFNMKVYRSILASAEITTSFTKLPVCDLLGYEIGDLPPFRGFLRDLCDMWMQDADVEDLTVVGIICERVLKSNGYRDFYSSYFLGSGNISADSSRVSAGEYGSRARKAAIASVKIVNHTGNDFGDDEEQLVDRIDEESEEEEEQEDGVVAEIDNVDDLIEDLDDYESAVSINLDEFHKKLGPKFSAYTIDEVARTIIKVFRDRQVPLVKSFKPPGTIIPDYSLQYELATKMGADESYARAAMSHLTVSVNVIRCDIQPDSFFSKKCRIVSEKPLIVHNGDYYAYFGAGTYIQFSRKEIRNYEPDLPYGEIWASCALLYTSADLRLNVQLPFWSKKSGTITQRIWTISEKVARMLPAHHKNLWNVIKRAADILKANKTDVVGWIEVRDPRSKKNVKKNMTLMSFVRACMSTLASTEVDFAFDRASWKALRDKTIFDLAWHKHEYKTLTLGSEIVPYNNTAIKFTDAYLNLVRTEKSWLRRGVFADPNKKIAILYGGVTSAGRNPQLYAMRHLFEELLGKSINSTYGKEQASARYKVFQFDLNGNSYTDTIQIDASKREDVMRLNDCTAGFDVVICILDLADGSVNSSLNVKLESWLSNFLVLDNINFVTTKYCCTSKLTVCGAEKIIPMNSVLFGTADNQVNVGRSHGAEGICLLTPTRKKNSNPVCLMPMTLDKDSKFREKCFEGSMKQFSPAATFNVPADYVRWFCTGTFTVAGFRGGSDVDIAVVSTWKAGAFEFIEETSDEDRRAPRVDAAPGKDGHAEDDGETH